MFKLQQAMHLKLLLFILSAFILALPMANAALPSVTLGSGATTFIVNAISAVDLIFNTNQQMDIKIDCFASDHSYCNASTACNLSLTYPNGTLLINGKAMQNQGAFHNYTSNPSYESGIYLGTIVCCDGILCGNTKFEVQVTPTGETKPSGTEILIITILFISLLAFMLFTFIWNFEHFVKGNTSIRDLGISLAYYFTLLAFILLNKLFFMNSEIGSWATSMAEWTSITHVFMPFVGLIWSMTFGLWGKMRRKK